MSPSTQMTRAPHSEKYTLPFIALLTVRGPWNVSMKRSRNPELSFEQKRPAEYRVDYDAFAVTTEFLDLRSPEDALRFFQKYGAFQSSPAGSHKPVRWSLVQRAQSEFNAALTSDSIPADLHAFVFQQPLRVELRFRGVTPEILQRDPGWIGDAAIADCDDVVTALRASVFLKRMKGFRWKRCARKGCNQLFVLDTKRDRIYCSPACGHLEAVNRYNARKKKRERRKR